MISALISALLVACPLPAQVNDQGPGASVPNWIWISAEGQPDQHAYFTRMVEVGPDLIEAQLEGSCDNSFELFLNGEQVTKNAEWEVALRMDALKLLKQGQSNFIAIHGWNQSGPGGMWFKLGLKYEDGRSQTIISDGSWTVQGSATDGWTQARTSTDSATSALVLAALGDAPWGLPRSTMDNAPPRALEADALQLPEGFHAELVYNVPRESQGSWVSMANAPDGKLFVSDQYGGLYRVTPSPIGSGEKGTIVEAMSVSIGQAQGLLWAFDSLYVVGGTGGGEAGLYRVTDSDGDDVLDKSTLLRPLNGRGEHGPHAVRLSPDGQSLYVVAGNHTTLPEIVASQVPQTWQEDQLLPRLPDPRGHAVGIMAPGGWVCRTDPEGREWELIASGMRNAYDIAFNEAGDLFTFDSDMEWDVGLPWYRPTRVLHLVPGAEFGWRHGSGKWPASYPDSWPGVLDVGLGSPTGVVFAPESWPAGLGGSLLIADWAYGQVFAVQLQAAGSSYSGELSSFLKGKPFPVTDLTVQGETLYLTTGGRRVQSGLYRVTATPRGALLEASASKNAGATHAASGASELALAHERRALESMGAQASEAQIESIFKSLSSNDPGVQRAARTALERLPIGSWGMRCFELQDARAIILSGIAMARSSEPSVELASKLRDAWLALPLAQLEVTDQIAALRWLALIERRLAEANEQDRARIAALLDPLFPSGHEELDRELCRSLVSVQAPYVVERGLRLLDQGSTQEERIFYFYALANAQVGWTPSGREAYFRAMQIALRDFEGGASLTQYLLSIREVARKGLPSNQAPKISAYLVELSKPASPPSRLRSFVKSWTAADLQSKPLVPAQRDLVRGRLLLDEATCLSCHRFGNQGGNTGPDLAGAGNRFNQLDLLQALLDPSSQISDQYQDTELLTTDEDFFVGRLEGEQDGSVQLRSLPPESELFRFAPDEIAELKPHPYSRMPEGLLDSFDEGEVLDLLAALIAGPAD